jgi:ABC-type molybdate transport system substrate-binding protein
MALAMAAACTSTAGAQTAATAASPAGEVPTLGVYAAGSLRAALTEVQAAFERQQAARLNPVFGASGLLKDRIVGGEAPQVFASANMDHPQALVQAGKADAVTPFARNTLCALAAPGFALQGKPLALRLLDADVRVGTSMPKADPAGDYAFAMFDRIEATGSAPAGAAAALKAKALTLTGGPDSPRPPPGRNVYGELMAAGQADVFITYCTNTTQARQQQPQLQVLEIPGTINVGALYGLALLKPVGALAQAYAQFLLGPQGQAILASHGFRAP